MAALVKVSGRRVEVITRVVPDPPRAPFTITPVTPGNAELIPPPADPPARDPWNYVGGFFQGDQFIAANTVYKKVITVSGNLYSASFSGSKQLSAWISTALVKLYPDYHPLARTVIPEWDYFNW